MVSEKEGFYYQKEEKKRKEKRGVINGIIWKSLLENYGQYMIRA